MVLPSKAESQEKAKTKRPASYTQSPKIITSSEILKTYVNERCKLRKQIETHIHHNISALTNMTCSTAEEMQWVSFMTDLFQT